MKEKENGERNEAKPFTFFGVDPFVTAMSQQKIVVNEIDQNKNEVDGYARDGEMIEFSNQRMFVPGNCLVVEGGKRHADSLSSFAEHERQIRSISGSIDETDDSVTNN